MGIRWESPWECSEVMGIGPGFPSADAGARIFQTPLHPFHQIHDSSRSIVIRNLRHPPSPWPSPGLRNGAPRLAVGWRPQYPLGPAPFAGTVNGPRSPEEEPPCLCTSITATTVGGT